MTDQDLLRAYANQADVDCLGTFILRYQDSLMRFVTKYLGDGDAAQDVVQETFLQVAERPKKLFQVENCHNWLLRVARNIGIDHVRRKKTQKKHTEAFAHQATEASVAKDDAAQPSRAVERDEVRAQVQDEIARLKPRYRELLLLKIVEQKTYKEIADITGLTATNVGYLLHQAMKILSDRLQNKREELL